MKWFEWLVRAVGDKSAYVPRTRKGLMNANTVKGDKIRRAMSRHGTVYGRKTYI